MIKKLLLAALAVPLTLGAGVAARSAAAAEVAVPLEHAPIDVRDMASLQAGARTYMNYCLGCHSLSLLRHNQLLSLGLAEDHVRDNLMFTAEKIGEPIMNAMDRKEAAKWFGVAPPDLSVIARSRGADWLYSYLRGFYRDPTTVTGWNNVVFPNVGMPHVLWTLQGERVLVHQESKGGHATAAPKFRQISAGAMTSVEYDAMVRDLTNFLVWAGEPQQLKRKQIGVVVLLVLTLLAVLAWLVKREYWKDVH